MNLVSQAENAEFGEICKFRVIVSGDRTQCSVLQGCSVTLRPFFILPKNEYKNSLLTEFSSKFS